MTITKPFARAGKYTAVLDESVEAGPVEVHRITISWTHGIYGTHEEAHVVAVTGAADGALVSVDHGPFEALDEAIVRASDPFIAIDFLLDDVLADSE